MGKMRPFVFILAVCGASLFIVSYLNLRILTEKDFAERRAAQKAQAELYEYQNTLDLINKYQKKYFEIVKRNDLLLLHESNDVIKKDEKQLSELYDEVKGKINPENPYYKKYNEISKQYETNPGQSTVEMNQFASEEYKAKDDLLNEVYQSVISILPDNDVSALRENEQKWLDEVEEYNKHFEAQDYGTIGYLVKSGYECDMRSFRTLLLMLYLN